ncbi:hypothetical protein M758_10G151400 [Ceratodon purpureus]|uniref:PRA1 family protein n=1 Tax=Ceratodon purpureus TaxID=3225 RepID=A0A8T0GPJ5_CERPU|nr:hypothetical protein KC19_10G156500 [Ceratodon purpureus]KAG0604186.1 hypothetical protein M758_10G151400 [Ceratodon purpureus]
MAFKENPLSLSVSQTAFEEWLRENGHLETLDRTELDHHLRLPSHSSFREFSKAVKSNAFMNLTVDDLLKKPVSWTGEFFDCGFGPGETYSWPRSISQAKMRMDENIRRYTGNYVVLVAIVFLILLYQMPMALVGIISVILVWDTLRRAGDEWGLERNGYRYRALAFVGNSVTVVLMVYCKIALALFWAGIGSLLVVTAHSCLRRITSTKAVPAGSVQSARSPAQSIKLAGLSVKSGRSSADRRQSIELPVKTRRSSSERGQSVELPVKSRRSSSERGQSVELPVKSRRSSSERRQSVEPPVKSGRSLEEIKQSTQLPVKVVKLKE